MGELTAVNMFNYMFMQEYFASILGLDVGEYYHIANNFHYYDLRHRNLVEKLASIENVSDDFFVMIKNFDR